MVGNFFSLPRHVYGKETQAGLLNATLFGTKAVPIAGLSGCERITRIRHAVSSCSMSGYSASGWQSGRWGTAQHTGRSQPIWAYLGQAGQQDYLESGEAGNRGTGVVSGQLCVQTAEASFGFPQLFIDYDRPERILNLCFVCLQYRYCTNGTAAV